MMPLFPDSLPKTNNVLPFEGMTWTAGYFRDAFRDCSLKYIYYIVDPRRHPLERACWLAWCTLAGLGAAWLSLSTWSRFQRSPTVLSVQRDFLLWNTTLPAFTICPQLRVEDPAVRTMASAVYPEDVDRGVRFLKALSQWTYPRLGQVPEEHRFHPSQYLRLLAAISYNFSYTLPPLLFQREPPRLYRVLTEAGICYSFNSQVAQYLDPEYWLSGNRSLKEPPYLIHGNLLDVDELFAQVDDINAPFNIYMHGYDETIDGSTNLVYPIGPHTVLHYSTTLITTYSTEATRKLSVLQRKCRFQEDSNLENSPVYSYVLCRAECRMFLGLRLCGCVPYFYRNNGKYKICGPSGMNCLTKYKDRLLKLREGRKREKCNCLQNCDSAHVEIHQADQALWNRGTSVRSALYKYPKLRLKRDIVFSFGDLLVQMGGAAGLCFGCSILTAFELLYLTTFRFLLFLVHKNNRRRNFS